jgi:hypothetical protein
LLASDGGTTATASWITGVFTSLLCPQPSIKVAKKLIMVALKMDKVGGMFLIIQKPFLNIVNIAKGPSGVESPFVNSFKV